MSCNHVKSLCNHLYLGHSIAKGKLPPGVLEWPDQAELCDPQISLDQDELSVLAGIQCQLDSMSAVNPDTSSS